MAARASIQRRRAVVPQVKFIEHNGTEHLVDGEPGRSLMEIAVSNMVPGILADCGGACTCATCHGYLDPDWVARVPARSEDETMMLECAPGVTEQSRLCCQVKMQEEWDGIVVRLPASQV